MLKGSLVALITPFHKDGTVNYEKLRELIEYHIANKTDGIVLLGTTGEAVTIAVEERFKMIQFSIDVIQKRVPLIVGASTNDTLASVAYIQKLNEYAIDYYLCITPYYNKTSQKGLIAHFQMLADAAKCPIILYHVPSRTGMKIEIDTLAVLAKHPNIIGIKEASGSIDYACRVEQLINDDFIMISGNDDMILPMMSLGAKGVISVLANVCPKEVHDLCEYCLQGQYEEALKLHHQLYPLAKALFLETNPIPVKAAMNDLGFDVGTCHLPLVSMEEANHQQLRNILKQVKGAK